MFSGTDFEESRQDRITVQGVDYHALQLLVDYVYTAIVEVTEENVQVMKGRCSLKTNFNVFLPLDATHGGQPSATDRCARRLLRLPPVTARPEQLPRYP